MGRIEIVFGWGAPPFKEQLPHLDEQAADHFDRDNMAVIRLHFRGLITDSQRDAALKKLTRKVEAAYASRPRRLQEGAMGNRLTEAQRRNLALLSPEFTTLSQLAAVRSPDVRWRGGLARSLSFLVRAGFAEWTVVPMIRPNGAKSRQSAYRLTPAGRAALAQSDAARTTEGE